MRSDRTQWLAYGCAGTFNYEGSCGRVPDINAFLSEIGLWWGITIDTEGGAS